MADDDRFDVVIVGAGPAGCVAARRLTDDPWRRVALVEAGPDYGPDATAWPADLRDPTNIWPESHPWGYLHAGRPANRPLPLPRARVVGGSSTINACIWVRGSAVDYDDWAALGNPDWSFADLLPYFNQAETDPIGGPLHGSDGPIPIFRQAEADLSPVDRGLAAAAATLGMPFVADLNGDPVQRPCIGPTPKNIAAGMRMNAAFTYLAPVRSRANLTLFADTLVDRVCFADGRATGVRTADGREIRGREVVLSAGAYCSPAILLRSGIGPAADLQGLGVPVVADRPGVGEHLLDHPNIVFSQEDDLAAYWVKPQFAPTAPSTVSTLLKARSRQAVEEVDLYIVPGQFQNEERGRWFAWFALNLEVSRSRGHVRLTAQDPTATLDIDHAYLSEPSELEACCDGIELIAHLAATPPLADMIEDIPGTTPAWRDRDELRAWVLDHVATCFHPSSTCRMGPEEDPRAVVDHEGRVYGVAGLRVIDAAVFPTTPRANLHCTVVAVAEKLAGAMRSSDRA